MNGLVFLAVVAMAALAARQAGVLPRMEQTNSGRFTAIDGDSLRKAEQEYRLHAIDAPEFTQTCRGANGSTYACGREARQQLARLIGSGLLACQIADTDRYQRLVADCRAGTVNINEAMVRSGWAIAYRRHGHDYVAAEADARKARRGLWQGEFEMPEDWRSARRGEFQRGSLMGEGIPDD